MKNVIIVLLILVLGIVLGIWMYREFSAKHKKEKVSIAFIESKLSDCSDLTTCNLDYTGLVKYANGSIPLISKKSFSMIYSAQVRAGIDLSKATVSMNSEQVRVQLPPTEIQTIHVDTEGLKFYDEHFALFNWDRKEDLSVAVKAAKDDVEKNANLDHLKAQARNQAEMVIYKLIEPAVGKDKRIIIE